MDFWDKQQSLSAADIAAQGKKERYARKWRNTTVAAVDKLDASGDAAVRTAFLHICGLAAREPPTAQILVADPRAYIASIIAGQPAVPDEGQLTAERGKGKEVDPEAKGLQPGDRTIGCA